MVQSILISQHLCTFTLEDRAVKIHIFQKKWSYYVRHNFHTEIFLFLKLGFWVNVLFNLKVRTLEKFQVSWKNYRYFFIFLSDLGLWNSTKDLAISFTSTCLFSNSKITGPQSTTMKASFHHSYSCHLLPHIQKENIFVTTIVTLSSILSKYFQLIHWKPQMWKTPELRASWQLLRYYPEATEKWERRVLGFEKGGLYGGRKHLKCLLPSKIYVAVFMSPLHRRQMWTSFTRCLYQFSNMMMGAHLINPLNFYYSSSYHNWLIINQFLCFHIQNPVEAI